ncbi:hypothetical protein RKE30_02445 [Streptomyces sp. Li-HN-5-11]|uniref:hypothetical protein n=1 Tax=Streptomyces sp. Li-HN-5-11 TaxID=3075432 RepID=UPI0028AB3D83|nr:hypothetical protein [Streptomyces sp. Li-HN-5-11]WNM36390.1 hypothetical protein RKE30_02445 [Streptomyces sp. Li-HN-5-11]
MAFGVEELRVLRRALALALQPRPASAEDVRDCLRLAESLDEAIREGARLRAFLVADLARYRHALPGTATGYVALLAEALGAGYEPVPDDFAALRALRGNPAAAALLRRCAALPGRQGHAHLSGVSAQPSDPIAPLPQAAAPTGRGTRPPVARPTAVRLSAVDPAARAVPASRSPLRAAHGPLRATRSPFPASPQPLPGGLPAARGSGRGDSGEDSGKKPAPKPAERPAPAQPRPAPAPGTPKPARRPIPTPGEVFPRRKPTPPSKSPQEEFAAV